MDHLAFQFRGLGGPLAPGPSAQTWHRMALKYGRPRSRVNVCGPVMSAHCVVRFTMESECVLFARQGHCWNEAGAHGINNVLIQAFKRGARQVRPLGFQPVYDVFRQFQSNLHQRPSLNSLISRSISAPT
jgi:hypothetical protein